jgi:hypothetical protein
LDSVAGIEQFEAFGSLNYFREWGVSGAKSDPVAVGVDEVGIGALADPVVDAL